MNQSRNLNKYKTNYANGDYDFENTLISYRRKIIIEFLEKYNPRNILEIGCGRDSIANYWSGFDKFVIVEPIKDFLEAAVRADCKNVYKYCDCFENVKNSLIKENFDFIILSGLLHEVINPESFLNNVSQLCIPNKTILHINVPNSNSFHLLWAYESGLLDSLDSLTPTALHFQQNTKFNLESLTDLSEKNSLFIIDKGSYFVKPFNHKKMKFLIENNVIDESLLKGLFGLTKYMPELGCEIFINCEKK